MGVGRVTDSFTTSSERSVPYRLLLPTVRTYVRMRCGVKPAPSSAYSSGMDAVQINQALLNLTNAGSAIERARSANADEDTLDALEQLGAAVAVIIQGLGGTAEHPRLL